MFGNYDHASASLNSFSANSEIKCRNLPVSLIFFINFPDSIHWVMSGDELVKELLVGSLSANYSST